MSESNYKSREPIVEHSDERQAQVDALRVGLHAISNGAADELQAKDPSIGILERHVFSASFLPRFQDELNKISQFTLSEYLNSVRSQALSAGEVDRCLKRLIKVITKESGKFLKEIAGEDKVEESDKKSAKAALREIVQGWEEIRKRRAWAPKMLASNSVGRASQALVPNISERTARRYNII